MHVRGNDWKLWLGREEAAGLELGLCVRVGEGGTLDVQGPWGRFTVWELRSRDNKFRPIIKEYLVPSKFSA